MSHLQTPREKKNIEQMIWKKQKIKSAHNHLTFIA